MSLTMGLWMLAGAPPPAPAAASPAWVAIIIGGVVGSALTYALTWFREHRRTTDAYRAPQRQAIGGIITATCELLLRDSDLREAMTDLVNQGLAQPGQFGDRLEWLMTERHPMREVQPQPPVTQPLPLLEHLEAVASGMNRAVLGVDRAFRVGRLTIVDPRCYEAMAVAYNEFLGLKGAFGDRPESADDMARMTADIHRYAKQLDGHVDDLVLVAYQRVSPVQSVWNRVRRREVRRSLDARYFEQQLKAPSRTGEPGERGQPPA